MVHITGIVHHQMYRQNIDTETVEQYIQTSIEASNRRNITENNNTKLRSKMKRKR